MDDVSVRRFLRKVAFDWPQSRPPPSQTLDWALGQFADVPPIDIIEADGSRRRDLPQDLFLVNGMDATMAAYDAAYAAEDAVNALSKSVSKEEFAQRKETQLNIPYKRLEHWKEVQARGTTALYGKAPVFERFWHFWSNHFMVAPGNARNDVLIGPYQRSLRDNMPLDFRSMLWAAVTHPGMLTYLDNHRNTGPNSIAHKRRSTKDSVNENLGRELLELFTLSPAAAYSQKDVEEATLILTGWGIARHRERRKDYRKPGTFFDHDRHEPGERRVLGRTYASVFRPTSKLEDLITDLALHPATAKHIAHKLCVYFLQDDPPAASVQAVEAAFINTKGHLPSIHQEVVRQAWLTLGQTKKFASPETWLLQAHRTLEIELPRNLPLPNMGGVKYIHVLENLGQPLPRCPQPNGWPIKSTDWISKELIDRRIRYALLMQKEKSLIGASRSDESGALVVLHPDYLWS